MIRQRTQPREVPGLLHGRAMEHVKMSELGSGRILDHPVLGGIDPHDIAVVDVDGRPLAGIAGEPLAMTLLAHGIVSTRTTPGGGAPRGYFCGVGRCGDCAMTVDGQLSVRTCMVAVRDGMKVRTQHGLGSWDASTR
jgi:hypothetical protein